MGQFWSLSTTSSGSTPRRRARSRSRCGDSRRTTSGCCSPGGWSRACSRRNSSVALGAERVRQLRVGAPQRRSDSSVAARAAGNVVRAPDIAPHPRAVGRQSVLRARGGARSRRGRRSASAACRSPRRSKSSCARRISGLPALTRDALAFASALGTTSASLARARRRGCGCARRGGRRARDRARERDDPLHSPVAVVGSLPRPGRGAARVHARIAEIVDDPLLRARHIALSTETPDADVAAVLDEAAVLQPIAARRPSRQSSPSKRSG